MRMANGKMVLGGGSKLPYFPGGTATWVLFLLAGLHLCSELGHFLIGVVSKSVARDIHYGTHACYPSKRVPGLVVRGVEGITEHQRLNSFNVSECLVARNQTECEVITANDGDTHACHWDWTGFGGEYQILAGPAFMAVFTIASLVWGMLADKFDRINILFGASILFSLALMFTAVSTKFWHLIVLRMMLAAGVAGIAPIAPGIIFDMFSQNQRALAMGFFHWGMYLGNGLSFLVGKYVTEMNLFNAGWRGTFIVSGLPGSLLSLLALFTVEDPPKSQESSSMHLSGHHHHHHHHIIGSGDDVDHDEEDHDETDVVEDCCDTIDEAQVLITTGNSRETSNKMKSSSNSSSPSSPIPGGSRSPKPSHGSSPRHCLSQPVIYLLGLGACIRHSAGYTWSYNSALYFQTYYPTYASANIWLTWITIFGGSLGVVLGGFVSDRLVSRLGIPSRALVLAASQLIAAPFALGLLYLDPPYAFISLFVGFLFSEMWYSVVFAILMELLPVSYRSLGLAVSLFIVNNVGGNLPVIVTPLSSLFGFRDALLILYPGALLVSFVLFMMTYIVLRNQK